MNILSNYPLKSHNTFGINANARLFAEFNSADELYKLLANPLVQNENKLILGGGSNILFTSNFDGIILKNQIRGIDIIKEDKGDVYVKAGSGVVWHDLVQYTIDKNLGGIENLSLIPGTVGAAPIQNIGAYGVEVKDVLDSLEVLDISNNKTIVFTNKECEFGYRDSIFKRQNKDKFIILSVTLKLTKEPQFNTSYGAINSTLLEMGHSMPTVKAISEAVCQIRRSKLPDPQLIGNAGSFFKNPEITEEHFEQLKSLYSHIPSFKTSPGKVKIPAGWLNEQCGWKGKVIGETGVHNLQALVLVNYGNALGSEVKKLAEDIQLSVKDKFGIDLEMEVNIV